MIIKKKLYSWLSKFKPGVKFNYCGDFVTCIVANNSSVKYNSIDFTIEINVHALDPKKCQRAAIYTFNFAPYPNRAQNDINFI